MKTTSLSNQIAVFIGVAAGFSFLIGILFGLGKSIDIIMPCLIFAFITLLSVSVVLFNKSRQ